MIEENLISILALLPFFAAVAAATLPVDARNAAALIAGGTCAVALAILVLLFPQVTEGRTAFVLSDWVPMLGLRFTLRLDGFVWLFLMLVFGIGILVTLYARYYLDAKDPVPRFYAFLLAFTGSMAGVLLAGNVLLLVVFWELTSLFSFLLISYWHQSAAARDGARTALILTAAGGLCLLLAMLLLGRVVGSYELDRILRAGDVVRAHALYPVILGLFLMGAFTKSAQFPFQFWLPGAMAAPTPVSAFLHSATLVKAGVFLLVRFSPVLGGTPLWFALVAGIGITTMVIGAVIAFFRHDLKGLLAYSTISHLGLIVTLAGIGSPAAIIAAIFHIVNHAVFKASLFMAAGIIDHETGTRDMRKLGGLIKVMPRTGVLAIVASAAMAGVPLLNGFLSKEMFFAEAAAWNNGSFLDDSLPYLATFASIFSVAYSLRFIMQVFFGPLSPDLPKAPHEPPSWMRRPVELLVLLCVLIGVAPALIFGPYLELAAHAVLGPDLPYYSLAIWHGWNLPLMMSLVAMAAGSAIYFLTANRVSLGPEGPPLFHRLRGQAIFDRLLLRATRTGPRRLANWASTERLQGQLRLLVVASLAMGLLVMAGMAIPEGRLRVQAPDPVFALIWIVGCGSAIGAAYQAKYHRFAALVLLGGAGLCTCLTFVQFSAPDLAVTQLLVEIVTTVLLLLGLRWMPKRRTDIYDIDRVMPKVRRARDLVIAVLCGAGVAMLAFVMMTSPKAPSIGDWFLQNAYTEGGGTNVVNVMLVDFRAFDTFGEVTVLCIVGITIFALLRRFRPTKESIEPPEQQIHGIDPEQDLLLVPSVIMRWMFPAIIAASAYLFFRGHDLPGGGFAAGVTLAIAFLLQYLAQDVRTIEAQLTILPIRWMATGLILAALTGMGAWLFGYPFLTAEARYLDIPLIGKVPAATAMLFDAGVFAVVVGSTVIMLVAIAHQSLRAARAREKAEERAEEEAEDGREMAGLVARFLKVDPR